MRLDEHDVRAFLPRLPYHVARFYARRLGFFVFCQNDSVPPLGISRNGDRLVRKVGIEPTLDGRVKVIQVAVKNKFIHRLSFRNDTPQSRKSQANKPPASISFRRRTYLILSEKIKR